LARYWKRVGFVREGNRVLDVGAGCGHIAGTIARELGARIDCIEPSESQREVIHGLGLNAFANFGALPPDAKYDAVTMIEVVEHVDDPVALLAAARNRLAPGGRVFVSTPGGDLKRPMAEPWRLGAYNTDSHIQFFTPSSLETAFRNAGFRRWRYRYVLAFYPADDKDDAVYESRWARRYSLEREVRFWFQGGIHLTYFAG
jgi:cyclopropane fatty-acyl-phospholipid synthase-like methyltransferase